MTRFTARAFRRKISKKTRRSKKGKRHTRRQQKGGGDSSSAGRALSTPTVGGGNTFSRDIPNAAVKVNPMEWDD